MLGSEVWAIIFLITGAVLIILEFITPTNFELFAFGLGFFTLAGLTYLGVSLWVQILAFIFVVSLTIFLSYKFARKTTEGAKDFSPISVVGKEGRVVLVEGDKVVVRVEGEDWLAEGEGEFKVGDKVVVLEVLGNKIRIKRR
jgi:membrane protein implicated in regulation of membrane protease activity